MAAPDQGIENYLKRAPRRRHRSYFTGLVTTLHDLRGRPRVVVGTGRTVAFQETAATKTIHQGREVVITAPSRIAAQRALHLIRAGLFVLRGEPMIVDADEQLVAWNRHEPEVEDRDVFDATRGSIAINGIPNACLLAARASRRRRWQYAITKYRFSARLCSAFRVDLEPFRSDHLPLSPFVDDHIVFSHAIVAAYSAIEDLGLQIKASSTMPSRLPSGGWNPPVREDLEKRLRAAGVSCISQAIACTASAVIFSSHTRSAGVLPARAK